MSFPGDDHHIYRGWPNRDVGGPRPRAFHPFHPYTLPPDGHALNGRRPDALTSFSRHSNDDEILRPHRQDGEGKGNEKNDMEDPKGRARFGEYLINTTGFQGPGKIREAPFSWLKVLWILGFLVACGFMVFQLVKLFEEFFSFPTKTVVELKFNPLPLPALTLCNVNPVRRSFAKNLSCPLQSLFKIPDHLRSQDCAGENFTVLDLDAFDYYCDDCEDDSFFEEEDLDDFAERRENIALYLGKEDRETRRYVGHQLEDMVIDCYLFGRPCSFRNVTGFLSRDYGNCYTLSTPNVKATKSGQEAALVLTLNLEAEEFIEGYKTGYGIRVVLHENGTRPFPSSQGFTLSSGSETDIAVRMTQVKRKGGKYGECDQGDVVAAISGYKYTIANCQDQCVHKKMVDDCGCIALDDEEEEGGVPPAAGSTAIKFCSSEAEYKCTYKAWNDYVNASANKRGSTCNCHTPCQELIYTSTLSTRTWPILGHLPVLEEQVCKLNDQSPKCSYLGVDLTMEDLDVRRSFTRVRLYYEQLNYEFVEEQPFYDMERFLSDIGGTLGLWIGVTALGLLELFELLFLALNTCRRRKSRA